MHAGIHGQEAARHTSKVTKEDAFVKSDEPRARSVQVIDGPAQPTRLGVGREGG